MKTAPVCTRIAATTRHKRLLQSTFRFMTPRSVSRDAAFVQLVGGIAQSPCVDAYSASETRKGRRRVEKRHGRGGVSCQVRKNPHKHAMPTRVRARSEQAWKRRPTNEVEWKTGRYANMCGKVVRREPAPAPVPGRPPKKASPFPAQVRARGCGPHPILLG